MEEKRGKETDVTDAEAGSGKRVTGKGETRENGMLGENYADMERKSEDKKSYRENMR